MTNRCLVFTLVSGLALPMANESTAQDLLDLYREGRMRAIAEEVVHSGVVPLPPEHLGRRATELEYWPKARPFVATEPFPEFQVNRFQKVPKLGREWFRQKFPDLRGSYEGSSRLSPLDTTYTRELRARLEAQFGSPTQTLPDLGPLRKLKLQDYVQFEYWFVLNDSIPLIVFDVNGPFERGLVAETDERYQDVLISMRNSFLHRLVADPLRKKYADYYYEPELNTWFLTGFDGQQFFLTAVDPRRVAPGRPVVPSK